MPIDIPNACTTSANQALGTTSLEALSCNLGFTDNFANTTVLTVTNRVGLLQDSVAGIQAKAIAAVRSAVINPVGVFGTASTIVNPNDAMLQTGVGYWYYTGALPHSVSSGDTPVAPAWTPVTVNNHEALTNFSADGGHDAIYSREFDNIVDLLAYPEITDGFAYSTKSSKWISKGTNIGIETIDDFKKTDKVNVFDYEADGDGLVDSYSQIQSAFNDFNAVNIGDGDSVFSYSNPIMFKTLCNINGQGAGLTTATVGGVPFVTNCIKKTTNNTVFITSNDATVNDVTVDCLLYSDAQFASPKPFPQNMKLENLAILSDAPVESEVGIYLMLGGGWDFRSLNIQNVTYAIKTQSCWRATFTKIQTNGIFYIGSGTSYHFHDCTADSTRFVDGAQKNGGWDIRQSIYSSLNGCTSDGGRDTPYKFSDCQGFEMNNCGAEAINVPATGEVASVIDFKQPCNQFSVNGGGYVLIPSSVVPVVKVWYNCQIEFNSVLMSLKQAETPNNIDIYMAGDNSDVYFNNCRFCDGSYTEPRIKWANTSPQNNTNSVFVTHKGKTRRYYTKNDGKTYVQIMFDQVGSNATGAYNLKADGTAKMSRDVPSTLFQGTATSSFSVQGLTYYRSPKYSWTFPIPFTGSPYVSFRGEHNSLTSATNGTYDFQVNLVGLNTTTSGELFLVSLNTPASIPFDRMTLEATGFWNNGAVASKSV